MLWAKVSAEREKYRDRERERDGKRERELERNRTRLRKVKKILQSQRKKGEWNERQNWIVLLFICSPHKNTIPHCMLWYLHYAPLIPLRLFLNRNFLHRMRVTLPKPKETCAWSTLNIHSNRRIIFIAPNLHVDIIHHLVISTWVVDFWDNTGG